MSWRVSGKIARRELRSGLSGFRILIACLALGVAAIAAVGTVRSGIQAGLVSEGAALLGGDAEAEFTYRFATDDERAWMENRADAISQIVDFRSMAVVERDGLTERGLTQIKAIDEFYPLYGTPKLQSGNAFDTAFQRTGAHPPAVMERLLADRLALNIGDPFKLGTATFQLADVITYIPDGAGDGFGLGPRTIVMTKDLENSGLLASGTLFSTKYRMKLPSGTNLDTLASTVETDLASSGLRWRDAREASPSIAEFVDRLGSFLILVGLAGLAVGGIGVSSAVRTYLDRKTSVIATLRSIGADNATVFQTYFLQIAALSSIGILIGLILGIGAPIAIEPVLSAMLPFPITLTVFARPIIEATLYGALAALIFTIWPLARAENIKAAILFRDGGGTAARLPRPIYVIITLGLTAILLASACYFTGSIALTLWTAVGVIGALAILSIAAIAIRKLAHRLESWSKGRSTLRWALSAIGGTSEGATAVILSIGLGLSVLASIGQIDGNLRQAIKQDLPGVAPSYFFVDIQKSQMPEFREILKADENVSDFEEAPMLRGIVSTINDKPAAEVAGDHWVIQGDRGLTYAAAPGEDTEITQGDWWPEDYTGSPQISFAAEEGAEMGLKLGDKITMNILGRDITGTITSFRNVDFSTAGIGFIMTMNPSALAGAPHSFIATVYTTPEHEADLLRTLAEAFPNITAIRVKDAIDRVSTVLNSIASATAYGAMATLLTGFLVLIGSAASALHARRYEAAILKTLGATRRSILTSFALRAAIMGASAGIVAIGAGALGGWAVTYFVMETDFSVIWPNAFAVVVGGVLANVLANLAFAMRALNAPAAQILRARE